MKLSGQEYRCSAGETFDSVALAVYGDEKHVCELLAANGALCTKPVFEGGERLLLPEAEQAAESAADYAPAKAPWKE